MDGWMNRQTDRQTAVEKERKWFGIFYIRILYQVHRLLGHHVDAMFVTPTNGISKTPPSEDDDRPHPSLLSIKEKNMIVLQHITPLSLGLVNAVDTR